jgi:hypothetical protein
MATSPRWRIFEKVWFQSPAEPSLATTVNEVLSREDFREDQPGRLSLDARHFSSCQFAQAA